MNRVVGFEVDAESRAVSDYKVEKDSCTLQSEMEKKEATPLLINDKGEWHVYWNMAEQTGICKIWL